MPFDPNKPFEIESQPSGDFQVESIPLRGSLGAQVDPSLSSDIAAARQVARETPSTGVFPEESQPISAIARGLIEGSTAGLGQAALEESIASDRFDPASPQFTNPYEFGISEIIGNFAPVGKIVKAALKGKALLTGAVQGGKAVVEAVPNLIKTGAVTGLAYGGAGGEAEALRKDADFVESVQSTLTGAGKGLVVGAATGGLINKVQASRMDPTETFLAFTKPKVGSKAQVEALHFTDSGKLQQAVGSIKNFFKLPKNITVEQARDLAKQTGDRLLSQVDDIAAQFPQAKLIGSRLQAGLQREVLDNPLLKSLNPGTQKELTDAATQISSDRTLKEALALQKKLNIKLKSSIKSRNAGGDPKLNDEITFLDTLRRENSKLIDDAITGLTGVSDNPYRRWGSVNELTDIIDARYGNLRNLGAQIKEAGIGGLIKRVKNLDFIGNETKSADNLISSLFNKIPEYQINPLLPRVAAQRVARSVQPPPPLSPVATPPIAPPTLNQLISQLTGGQPLQPPTTLGSGPSLGASTEELNAILQRILEEQAAARSASSVGFF